MALSTAQPGAFEPWRRPLLSQRKGFRSEGRPGELRGGFVNGGFVMDAADVSGTAAWLALEQRLAEEPNSEDLERDDAAEYRVDSCVEVVIDGTRYCQLDDGEWLPCAEINNNEVM